MFLNNKILENCTLCPRMCGVNRHKTKGFCGEFDEVRIARAELHFWEEPCISGETGSGTVFFSGCNLKCCFCQNFEISAENKGFLITPQQLADTFLMLQNKGANNINLVNPTHFVVQIIEALNICKSRLKIPIVYNCGGYENIEVIKQLGEYIDVFLPDLKYFDSVIAKNFSNAENYFSIASEAIKEMVKLKGKPIFDKNGMLLNGVMVRHLVLPNYRHDSIKLMKWLGENFNKSDILVSVMNQYTPVYKAKEISELNRKTSTFEYNSVCNELNKFGFDGYFQLSSSANTEFIPDFYNNLYYELP